MSNFRFVLSLFLALSAIPQRLMAQVGGVEPDTRAGQVEEQRAEKPQATPQEHSGAFTNTLAGLRKFTEQVPLRISVEGLGPGHGLTLSSTIERQTRNGLMIFKLFGSGEQDGFYTAGTAAEFPRLSSRHWAATVEGEHSDSPQLEYYGSGPNSLLQNRTNYRREDTIFSLDVRSEAYRHFKPNCTVSEWLLNVGPGTNQDLATTESVFGPAEAPGIDHQSNNLVAGCSARLDWRDLPEDPHRGTYFFAAYQRYDAQNIAQFSFHRFTGIAEQYIPLLNATRVIALLARSDWALHGPNQVVPFYLQSTLGSDTDLRGFRRYRFYDENAMALTAEYRWEISTGFDFAVFGDTGEVFHAPDAFRFSELRYSEGFGIRFKGPMKNLVLRLDTGFSKEGFQIWLKFAKQL